MSWEETLRHRLGGFHPGHGHDGVPVSIKIRAASGCYDRCCCPAAHRIIDDAMHQHRPDAEFVYERHESGPELLVFLATATVATATLTLAKSVIDLVTTIIKARSEGQKKGDHHHEPLELILRGFDKNGRMFEEKVLKIEASEEPTSEIIQKVLEEGLNRHLSAPGTKPNPKTTRRHGRGKT